MTTLSLAISASANDADEDAVGNVNTTNASIGNSLDSTSEWVGLRFTGTSVMNGGTVISSTVDVIPTGSNEDEPLITIWATLSDPGTWVDDGGTNSLGISNKTRTTASVSWSNTNLGANGTTRYSSPDISAVLNEVIRQSLVPAYSDNAIAVVFQGGATSTRDLTIKSYDSAVADAATLTIDFVPKNTQRMSMMGCG